MRKLAQRSERVKSVDLHPTKPWDEVRIRDSPPIHTLRGEFVVTKLFNKKKLQLISDSSMIGNVGTISQGSVLCYACQMPAKVSVSSFRSLWGHTLEIKPRGMAYTDMSSASSLLLSGGQNLLSRTIPVLPSLRKSCRAPRAMKEGSSAGFKFPPMTRKPRWWWRTLACIPYLLPIHQVWMYAKTAYNLHPFIEAFEFLTYPFFRSIGSLPRWSLIAYFLIAYLTIVRRKEWPHFFRFHVAVGMLIEIALQVTGLVSRWMPHGFYWGKIGMHFWTTAFFLYLFTSIECVRCALTGMYADIPFVCDAAYIQIPYEP